MHPLHSSPHARVSFTSTRRQSTKRKIIEKQLTNSLTMKKRQISIHILIFKSKAYFLLSLHSYIYAYAHNLYLFSGTLYDLNKELQIKRVIWVPHITISTASWSISCYNSHWFSHVQVLLGGANLPFFL